VRAKGGDQEDEAIKEALKMVERRRFHRGRRIQKESMNVATVCVMMAGSCMQKCVLPLVKKGMAVPPEEERLPAGDWLSNYRCCIGHRINEKPSRQ